MLNILDTIQEWIMEILRECIMGNLDGMFDQINTEVGEVAANVGMTPAAWNAGVFTMIRSLSDNVVVPIAGVILTFVLCYELISMLMERNSFHDFEIPQHQPSGAVARYWLADGQVIFYAILEVVRHAQAEKIQVDSVQGQGLHL